MLVTPRIADYSHRFNGQKYHDGLRLSSEISSTWYCSMEQLLWIPVHGSYPLPY